MMLFVCVDALDTFQVPEKKYSLKYGFNSKIELQFAGQIGVQQANDESPKMKITQQGKVTSVQSNDEVFTKQIKNIPVAKFCEVASPHIKLQQIQDIDISDICNNECKLTMIDNKLYMLTEQYLKIFQLTQDVGSFNVSFFSEILIPNITLIDDFQLIQNQIDSNSLLILGHDSLHILRFQQTENKFDKTLDSFVVNFTQPKAVFYGDTVIVWDDDLFLLNNMSHINAADIMKTLEVDSLNVTEIMILDNMVGLLDRKNNILIYLDLELQHMMGHKQLLLETLDIKVNGKYLYALQKANGKYYLQEFANLTLTQNLTFESPIEQVLIYDQCIFSLQQNMIATGYAGISPVIKLDPKYFRDITENVQQMIGVVSSNKEPSDPLIVLNRDLQVTEAAQPIEKNIYLFTLKSSEISIYELNRYPAVLECLPQEPYQPTDYQLMLKVFNGQNLYYVRFYFKVYREIFENANIALSVGLTIGLLLNFISAVIFCVCFYKMRTKYQQMIQEEEVYDRK